jgi:chromosome segregation ATPase
LKVTKSLVLKQDLDKETKFRLELQEKLNALETNHKKLKEQLNNAQVNATSAASEAREENKKSLVEQRGANITTIETIVKMEKDVKLLKVKTSVEQSQTQKDEIDQKKKKIDDMMEQETESRRQRNLLNQFIDEHAQKNARLMKTIEELTLKYEEEAERRASLEEHYSKQVQEGQVKLEGQRQKNRVIFIYFIGA